ncbi:MAG TPA: hypothetical protein VJU61_21690 [Polyangiaceae bacterium]|nr:hypothetical protein [Polyangiaceae bacterium]
MTRDPHPSEEHRAVSARLIETTVELVRAELAVMAVRARQVAIHSLTAALATIVAAALLQVALVVAVLSPLLLHSVPLNTLLLAIAVPLVLVLASLTWAFLSWRGVKQGLRSTASAVRDAGFEEGISQNIPQLVARQHSPGSQRTATQAP